MKIAVIAHSHYPIKQPFAGGLEAHTYMLVKQLQQAGHHVTLYAAEGSDPTLPYVPFFKPTAEELFRPSQAVKEYREKTYTSLMQHLQHSDFDVVHNNSLHYVPLQRVDRLPMPMVTVLHTPPFLPLVRGFQEAVRAKNHCAIAISQAVIQSWQEIIPALKPTLVYNGINTRRWLPGPQRHNHAIWFGRITPEKGTHLAIRAASLAGIRLRICGPIHNATYFAQEVEPYLSETSVYRGNLKTADLAKEVARASVFVCTPCWEEPFGLVAAEALSSGTPVAGFNRGALAEILTPATGVLVKGGIEALAIAIRQAQKLSSQACRQRAVAMFSVSSMVQGYTRLYQNLVLNRKAQLSLPLVS